MSVIAKKVSTTESGKKRSILPLHIAIMLTCIIGSHLISPISGVTEGGMALIGVFVAMLYGWTFCDLLWVSLLGIISIGFSGIVSLPEFLAMGFGSDTLIYMLFIFFFTGVLFEVGLIDYISNKMISFSFLDGRPWLFSTFLLIGAFISSAFINMFAALLIFWEIVFIISKRFGFEKKDKYPMLMLFGVTMVVTIGGAVMPYKPVPMVILSTYNKVTGAPMDFFKYILFSLPVTFLIMLFYLFICRFVFRPDLKDLHQISPDFADPSKLKLDTKQKVALLFLALFIFMMISPSILPDDSMLKTIISALGNSGTVMILLIVMLWLKFDGEPLADVPKLSEQVNYDMWVTMCFVIPFAGIFTSDATGIKESVVKGMHPFLSGRSELTFIILTLVIAVLFTNVANNMVVGAVFTTLIATIGAGMGMNVTPVIALLAVAVNLALATPAASPLMIMTFAMKDWMPPALIYKYAAITVVLCLIFCLLIGLPWAYLVY